MADDDGIPDISLKLFVNAETPLVRPKMRVVRDTKGDDRTYGLGDPDIKPCPHPEYALDDEWNTVSCSQCKERLDPYALLRHHAHYWEQLERKIQAVEEGRKILRAEQLRLMIERKGCPMELRARVRKVTLWGNARFASLDDLTALYEEVDKALDTAREKKREAVRRS